jgi:hypothetical protein
MKFNLFLGLCLFFDQAFARVGKGPKCQLQYRTDAKACPTSGATILDETYPVASYVISIGPFNKDLRTGVNVTSQFILQSLESFDFSPSSPSIIVPSSAEDFEELRAELRRRISSSRGKIPPSILDRIVHTVAPGYTWQQDYFESFINRKKWETSGSTVFWIRENRTSFGPAVLPGL